MAQQFIPTTYHVCGTCGSRREWKFSYARGVMDPHSEGRYLAHVDEDGDMLGETCEEAARMRRLLEVEG